MPLDIYPIHSSASDSIEEEMIKIKEEINKMFMIPRNILLGEELDSIDSRFDILDL